jgi:hypothetical protein
MVGCIALGLNTVQQGNMCAVGLHEGICCEVVWLSLACFPLMEGCIELGQF